MAPQLRDNRYYTTNALVHAWSTAVLQHQMQCRSVRSIHTRHSHLHVTDGKLNVHNVLSPVALTLHTVSVTHSICGHINTVTHIYLSYWLHIILWLHWYWLCGLLESGSGCWSCLPAVTASSLWLQASVCILRADIKSRCDPQHWDYPEHVIDNFSLWYRRWFVSTVNSTPTLIHCIDSEWMKKHIYKDTDSYILNTFITHPPTGRPVTNSHTHVHIANIHTRSLGIDPL